MGTDGETLAQCNGDLPHSWSSQHAAWNKGRLDNWVSGVGNVRTMGYLDRSDIPFHYALADNYTICDAYFCSTLSATGPNRTYLWSGKVDGTSYDGGDESGLTWQNYAEALQTAGVTWKVYQNAQDNYGDNGAAYFKKFADAKAGDPLHDRGMSSVPHGHRLHARRHRRRHQGRRPRGHLAPGLLGGRQRGLLRAPVRPARRRRPLRRPRLPRPRRRPGRLRLDRPVPQLRRERRLLRPRTAAGPARGHGGEFLNGVPYGLGFRVPMLVISPWTRGGWVSSEVFDHTSVLRFLETWTGALGKPAACPNISTWRRKVTGDLTGVFDFAHPVYGAATLPATSVIGFGTCGPLPNPVPTTNALPAQEPGTRPARALPYQPNGYLDHLEFGTGGKILAWFTMANQGTPARSAAHFSIHPNAYRDTTPWQYTVDAGGTASDYFNIGTGYGAGKYDISMTGPNRFLRRFKGDATQAGKSVEVSTRYATEPGTGKTAIYFRMANSASSSVKFTITSNQYRGDGPWTYTVAAGTSAEDYFNAVAYQAGWYDFTVTVDSDASWSRRFTGHIETGAASVSG